MSREREGGKVYVPTEPCHYGMIAVSPEGELDAVMGRLPPRRKRFELIPMEPLGKHEVDVVA
jgi:muconolactone delta-isomerase